jgi:glycosyltransferase involved in cell wall biosynthesis
MVNMSKRLVYVINVDWYFRLHWLERAEYFQSLGYSIHIISNFTDKATIDELISRGFVCHELSVRRKSINLLRELRSIFKLKGLIESINPDLIHCVTIKPNVYGGLLNRLFFDKPIIYSVTGLGAIFSSTSLKFVLLRRFVTVLLRLISSKKSRFVFENGEDYQVFTDIGILKHSNGTVIKGAGIDLTRFAPSYPPINKSVLFAARLLKDKGLHCLIDAKNILANRGVDFTLNVAGIVDNDVSSAIPLYQIEQWASKGAINWLGNVQDMPRLIGENDIVCLPTTYGEGVPRILIEAASCQRAIVTTNVQGCREIVTHEKNGLLVEPGDAVSLADNLQTLLLDRNKLIEFGICGREKVENEFSQEMVFERTHKVYNELLGL